MKENIFIEGDLVLHDNNVCKIEGKTLTCDTNLLEFYIVRTPNGCLYSIQPIEVTPIPLTPEILEKNGWELDNATWIYKKGYIRVFRLLDDKTYAAYILGMRVFEFHFIHELQHLLFGLGLNSEMEV